MEVPPSTTDHLNTGILGDILYLRHGPFPKKCTVQLAGEDIQRVHRELDKGPKSIYLLCGPEECSPQWTDLRTPRSYVEKALEGIVPDGRRHMYTNSDSPFESRYLCGVTYCDSYCPC